MNVADEIRLIQRQLADLNRRISDKISGSHHTTHEQGGSDVVTPAVHHARHESAGADAIKLDDLEIPDDNSDLNASIIRHGLLKKLPNIATQYMDGTGIWSVPAGGAGDSFTYYDPRKLPAAPSAQDDHFDDGALAVKWMEWDCGAANLTITEAANTHHVEFSIPTETPNTRWRGMWQTLPAGNFTILAPIDMINIRADHSGAGLALFEDSDHNPATCDLIVFFIMYTGNYWNIQVERWNQYDNFNLQYQQSLSSHYIGTAQWLRIRRNGTTLYYEASSDGVAWMQFYTHTQPFAPEQMGLVAFNRATAGYTQLAYFDLFRYIASDQRGLNGGVRSVA